MLNFIVRTADCFVAFIGVVVVQTTFYSMDKVLAHNLSIHFTDWKFDDIYNKTDLRTALGYDNSDSFHGIFIIVAMLCFFIAKISEHFFSGKIHSRLDKAMEFYEKHGSKNQID